MDRIPFWLLLPLVVVLMALPAVAGFWIARHSKHDDTKSDAPIGTIVGATLGFFAFMLAFTFNMAASRFDDRRQLVVEEAGAVQTLFEHTALLPEEHREEVRQLIREYVDIRIEAARDISRLPTMLRRSEEIHEALWARASQLAEADATSWTASWFVDPLSSVCELHVKRLNDGVHIRIPLTLWIGLGLITILSMLAMGYQTGLGGGWHRAPMGALILAFAIVIWLVADLDRPQQGVVNVSEGALIDVQQTIHAELNDHSTSIHEEEAQSP
jgi:hypothetical protein